MRHARRGRCNVPCRDTQFHLDQLVRVTPMSDTPRAMRPIPAGIVHMGSDRFYPEERPRRRVRVAAFWIDETPVTNRDFAAFVAATGHRTTAEIAPDPHDFPDMDPNLAHPGSLVFQKSPVPVPTNDPRNWWRFVLGADWRHPTGPDSSLEGLEDHPVVHVTHADASAYASWIGKSLPTEAEWEYAARGGLEDTDYAWGDTLEPEGTVLANYWRGLFPSSNLRTDGYRTTPVGSYPPNGYALSDMIGNVWEWTNDWYILPERQLANTRSRPCCLSSDPRGGTLRESIDRGVAGPRLGRKVIKGGSHLCAENYCQRYRPAARHPQTIDSSTSHVGFRCIWRP